MARCLELAGLGAGNVAPNPMVGSVLVHDGKIIGEGWHQQYGEAHAEVNCIRQALESGHETLLPHSAMYVSLEPCAHFGKTPPCADLIIRHRIPKVFIGCRDPFGEVNGKGIEKLIAAGVSVETGILGKESEELNKRFFVFHQQQRPYIILKWAQTADGKIAADPGQRLFISNELSNRLVHKWRSQEAAILVGTNTALLDNPTLTTRLWAGRSPARLVLDMNLRLPSSLKLLDGTVRTIVFNSHKHEEKNGLLYYRIKRDEQLVTQMLDALYQLNIQSVLIEGGARLLQTFIDAGVWDEARMIQNPVLTVKNASRSLAAPVLTNAIPVTTIHLQDDTIHLFKSTNIDP